MTKLGRRASRLPLLGGLFIVGGTATVWDALRITKTFRIPGAFDPLGPDRYLLLLAVLLLILGTALLLAAWRTPMTVPACSGGDEGNSSRVALLVALLTGYLVAILVLGYPTATFVFFVAAFLIMGIRGWTRLLVSSVILAGAFSTIFYIGADMPLPKGIIFENI